MARLFIALALPDAVRVQLAQLRDRSEEIRWVPPDQYQQNLKAIADSLLKEFPGCIIIFQHPIWYSPNTYNGAKYLQEGLSRLQTYIPKIDELVAGYAATHPKQVFIGDKKAFDYFKKHYLTDLTPENGHQGTFYLHPNKKGARSERLFRFDEREAYP